MFKSSVCKIRNTLDKITSLSVITSAMFTAKLLSRKFSYGFHNIYLVMLGCFHDMIDM